MVKKVGFKGGYGYCGFHTTKSGEKIFLRSSIEYLYALYLEADNIKYGVEKNIFIIDEKRYKPDFFIYKDDRLVKIVEIKSSKKEALDYIAKFKDFFTILKIEYEVFYDRKKLKKLFPNELTDWVNKSIENYSKIDYRGSNNPSYGCKRSDKTKKLIGETSIKKFKDPAFREKHKNAISSFWKTDEAIPIKERYANLRKEESARKNPLIELICKICGKTYFKKYKSQFHKETCSQSCATRLAIQCGRIIISRDGKKLFKSKIISVLKKYKDEINEFNFYDKISELKKDGKISKNLGVKEKTINKYFGSIQNFLTELKDGQASFIKD